MILLDTHALVWLDEGNKRLGPATLDMVNQAHSKGHLAVSAITFWEVAMLIKKRRLEISIELDVWRKNLLGSGLREIPLSGAIGIRASGLKNFHGDPADCMIAATALETSATLVTADKKILAWQGLTQKQNARF
jgi:PIN domain nuclease of toxin-antitoxin system